MPSLLPPADTHGGLDAEAAPEPAQYGGVAAGTFQIGSHLGNRSAPRTTRRYVGHGASGRNVLGPIPPMKQKVQLRALRWVPERAGVPGEGRGEAPIQHIPSQNQNNCHNTAADKHKQTNNQYATVCDKRILHRLS